MELSIQSLTQEVIQLKNILSAIQTNSTMQNTGSTYIRWGRSSCSGSDAQLVYSGYAAGQHYNQQPNRFGGPSNVLCVPNDPELSNITAGGGSYLFGTEFQENILRPDAADGDVPCAVCKSTNIHSTIMIPGRKSCYTGWKMEYYGLLASNDYSYSASTYICVDQNPEYIPGGQENEDGNLLYITKTRCGSLSCPPYKDNQAVNCVVCSQ